ncbi:MAG: site-specific DNA-methyltransferase [Flammeovirgaceae bacterium]
MDKLDSKLMNGESLNIKDDNLNKLKAVLPEVFSEDQLDWEKLKAHFGDNIVIANERYTLNWAGKSDAFKALQQPTTATLKPAPEESINFDTTGNVFIEGENLEVLKVLQKSYYGKVKCIIIDPPYNTGNDSFIYPDSFKESKADYDKRIGDKDEEGYLMKEGYFKKNSKDSGHFHSNWLSMMYPRLFLAKNLMRDDGVIFVHIDDNEVQNLRLVMNEIFGEENFVSSFIWKSRQIVDSRTQNGVSNDHEYIIVFCKNTGTLRGKKSDVNKYTNPDNDSRGPWMSNSILGLATASQRPNLHYDIADPTTGNKYSPPPETGWRYSRETMDGKIKDKRIVFPAKKDGRPREKKFLSELESEYTGFSSLLSTDVGFTLNGTRELRDLMGGNYFPFPKPVSVIKTLIEQGLQVESDQENIVLDFFGGSATTAQAILELNKTDGGNRKFVMVQLPELCEPKSEAYEAGYKTIADISKERIRRVIKKIEEEKTSKPDMFDSQALDLGFKVFKLSSSNFKIWRGNEITEENLTTQLDSFTNPVKVGSETDNMFYELLLKAGYQLTDKIEKRLLFYSVNDNELIIALETMSQETVEIIIKSLPKPKKVITLDILFANNDQLKTNTVLQMKDAGIDFKTI